MTRSRRLLKTQVCARISITRTNGSDEQSEAMRLTTPAQKLHQRLSELGSFTTSDSGGQLAPPVCGVSRFHVTVPQRNTQGHPARDVADTAPLPHLPRRERIHTNRLVSALHRFTRTDAAMGSDPLCPASQTVRTNKNTLGADGQPVTASHDYNRGGSRLLSIRRGNAPSFSVDRQGQRMNTEPQPPTGRVIASHPSLVISHTPLCVS